MENSNSDNEEWSESKLKRLTKKQLIDMLATMALKMETYKLRCQTAIEAEKNALDDIEKIKSVIKYEREMATVDRRALKQARSMIEAVINGW